MGLRKKKHPGRSKKRESSYLKQGCTEGNERGKGIRTVGKGNEKGGSALAGKVGQGEEERSRVGRATTDAGKSGKKGCYEEKESDQEGEREKERE